MFVMFHGYSISKLSFVYASDAGDAGVSRWQPHCRSGLATLPSVGAIP